MSPAESRRSQSVAVRNLAIGKIEWAKNPIVIERYKRVPETLASIVANAEEALRAADTLANDAQILEARSKGVA